MNNMDFGIELIYIQALAYGFKWTKRKINGKIKDKSMGRAKKYIDERYHTVI